MDKTPRYIEMSEKAAKMQASWKPQDGDWFAIKKDLEAQGEHYALRGEVYQVAYIADNRIYFMQYDKKKSAPKFRAYHLQYLREPGRFKLTFLPTQSRLQEMLRERIRKNQGYSHAYVGSEDLEGFMTRRILRDFLPWAGGQGMDCPFTSLEQFWLAFYLHEAHKRNWDDERREWVYLTRRERLGLYSPLTV